MLPRLFRVGNIHRETQDTFTLDLEPEAGGGAFAFAAGQFNMLYAFGVGEVPISISGDPADSKTLTHTVRKVGAVTKSLCGLSPGDSVGVRGPFGTSWPLRKSRGKNVLVMAGGIGLAPLRPVLHHLCARREDYGKVALLYGARTPQDLLYPKELEWWRGRFDLQVEVTVDTADKSWRGDVGVVTTLIPRVAFALEEATAMVCGPEVMMRFVVAGLREKGMPDEAIHISMERNMKCGAGFCGHCQYGPYFVCKDGPVFRYDRVKELLQIREL